MVDDAETKTARHVAPDLGYRYPTFAGPCVRSRHGFCSGAVSLDLKSQPQYLLAVPASVWTAAIEKTMDNGKGKEEITLEPASPSDEHTQSSNGLRHPRTPIGYLFVVIIPILLLFLNFFLAQYDKFVLSYFQADVISSLNLSSANYGILSGYATGVVYALLAIPVAFVADYTNARVWTLALATLWWSLCVVFQGLSHNFWQILLARIGMGIGQAPVEALSVSLISDLIEAKWMFFAER